MICIVILIVILMDGMIVREKGKIFVSTVLNEEACFGCLGALALSLLA